MKEAVVNLINFGYLNDDFVKDRMTFVYTIVGSDNRFYAKVIVGIAADASFALFLN